MTTPLIPAWLPWLSLGLVVLVLVVSLAWDKYSK